MQNKCDLYWPTTTTKDENYGGISVHLNNEEEMADFTIRHFSVTFEVSVKNQYRY
jgi:hypothetical protein